MTKTKLETEVEELRAKLTLLEERARVDAAADAFLAGDHAIREGDCFLLYKERPTRLNSVNSHDGKWTYFNGRNVVESAALLPEVTERLYTVAEVAEIVAKASGGANSDQNLASSIQLSSVEREIINGALAWLVDSGGKPAADIERLRARFRGIKLADSL